MSCEDPEVQIPCDYCGYPIMLTSVMYMLYEIPTLKTMHSLASTSPECNKMWEKHIENMNQLPSLLPYESVSEEHLNL